MILISATGERELSPQNDQLIRAERKLWESDIMGKLDFYEVPATHDSIAKDGNMKIVANIINEHALSDRT